MSLVQRVTDLANRIASEFNLVRAEMQAFESAGGPAGGVLSGTYPNPAFATDVLFDGRGLMSSLTVKDGLDVRGVNNKMSVGSLITLNDKTAGAVNPPVLSTDYEVVNVLTDYLYHTQGIHLDSTEGNRHSAGRFFGDGVLVNNAKYWTFTKVSPVDGGGAAESFFKPYAMTRIQNPAGPRSIVWGEEMKQGLVAGSPGTWKMEGIWMRSYDDAPMASDQPAISKVTPLRTTDFSYFFSYRLGRCFSATGAARASEFCAARADVWNGQLNLYRYSAADDGSFVNLQTITNISTPWFVEVSNGPAERLRGVAYGSSARMGFHGVNQDVWVVFSKRWAYVYNAAGTARLTDLEFPSAGDLIHFTIGDLATNDFAGFRAIPDSDTIPMTRYTDITWPDSDGSVWWIGYTWYDSAGTTHETNLSVPASITMTKRARLVVDVGSLPDPAAGAGQARGPDDVNSFRLYMQRSPTKPPNNAFIRQSTQPAALATKVYLSTMPVFTGTGLAPPDITNFPGAGPATIKSSAVAPDGTPKFVLRGDGVLEFESVDVGGPASTSLRGAAFDQMFYMQRAQRALNGGGRREVRGTSTAPYLFWSSRFLTLGVGRGTAFSTVGYFAISMPAPGQVINGYGGATNKTVVGGSGIPLAAWDVLWYELPFGTDGTSLPGNFRVTNYTSDFTVPSNWIMVAAYIPEGGYYIQWGDGVKVPCPGWYDVAAPLPGVVLQRINDLIGQSVGSIPNNGQNTYAWQPPVQTVPAGARNCHALIMAKGSWTTNAACFWYLQHISPSASTTVAFSRVHNNGQIYTPADSALFAIIPVIPGDSFNCYVYGNNDPGSGSVLTLGTTYYTFTFMS